jgi:uncharacterized membrane protein YozB (DUF420 family)
MFLDALMNICTLHAGTPVALSQLTLTVMLVVLGILLMGIGFGRISKTKQSLQQHRWTLTAAVMLTLGTLFLVMIPSFFVFYIDPDLQVFSSLSIITLIHGCVGIPAIVSALIYAFGDLPTNVRKWMRITAALWITTMIIGVVLFLQMLSLI